MRTILQLYLQYKYDGDISGINPRELNFLNV